jgi:multidrug efflux pump subunit AcrA (membrane-fusion protein)
MHPEVTSTNPNAECAKCGGMKLLPKEEKPAQHSTTPSPQRPAGKYTCPMHPQILADKPGECPICHMALVPVTDTQRDGAIRVSPETRQAIGLKLGTVATRSLQREIRAAARIVPDETKLHHVTLKTEGWIEQFHDLYVGKLIQKGEPLMTLYSPELLTAQREFLNAVQVKDANLIAAGRRRLELLDMTPDQIAALQEAGQPQRTVTLFAPTQGSVIERSIAAGHKVMPGEMLLTLADLTTVWAEAELFQSDLGVVPVGAAVELTMAGQTVTGKVTFVSPTLDPLTRTAKARVELPNADLKLKPEMLATARIAVDQGRQLALPAAAVMRTGDQAYVFRDAGEGKLEPVAVRLGARCGDYFPVLGDALKDGDAVVVAANFLIDSEAQIKGALTGMGHE